MMEILEALFLSLTALIAAYIVRHFIFSFAVLTSTQGRNQTGTTKDTPYQPIVSVLIPAYDEEQVIGRILQRMTELTYPKDKLKIIVIDDASKDNTGRIADQYSKAYAHVEVIHRNDEEGRRGKSSALNAALKQVSGEVVFCFDADYCPQRDFLEKLTTAFADPKVGAVQGRVTVLNEPKNVVTRLVSLERIGGYRVDQQAREILHLIPQYGGTAGGIRRSLLEQLGGWDETILAEDTDLTFRVYLAGYKVRYVNDAECYEEAVEDWRAYWRQRYRWSKGHMQCAFKHFLKVLISRNLTLREKIDGLLLLNVYFMPVLALLSWIICIPLFLLGFSQWFVILWAAISVSFYSFVGNFAPFFEVGVGAYLDGRTRAHWLISLLVFTFLYNIPICTKAFVDLVFSRILGVKNHTWHKTTHSGDGNSYITN
jgi:cellulose synthase/poly-beta-1,6-N-acetylglucosamine synthase-like glycosyltransferase